MNVPISVQFQQQNKSEIRRSVRRSLLPTGRAELNIGSHRPRTTANLNPCLYTFFVYKKKTIV